ncbi:efflux RND transporter periplasmic adaptor subunit [Exilibacterium tricleocarpae]|uniref:Efflux RND transporter periplasmic adaptor subunit n=1 Tax=Exilibacterium tricleocarpae TaxID=2591008 RepID=A0A545U3F0_9GAMM|nr:efflux RND transporter periplasmic adaptor subunit [Exilibacterium tricleocarpae]TQV83986.1 efflux RND transporter periplasmic adaptor subunit [Exilibacterium tricleocarpae]
MIYRHKTLWAVALLGLGVLALWLLPSLQPEAEKMQEAEAPPFVTATPIAFSSMHLMVSSYGFVQPRYETDIVSQVQGNIVYLSPKFMRGGLVKKGEVLVKIDDRDYQSLLVEAEADLAKAQADLALELARSKVAKAEWENITNKKPSSLGLRHPQLAHEMARLRGSEALLSRARNNLLRTKISAPFDGLVANRAQGLGAYVGAGTVLGTVMSTDVAEVRLPLAGKNLKHLADSGRGAGIGAEVTLASEFLGESVTWRGEVVREEGLIDRKSRMSYLVAEIADPYKTANPGESAVAPLRFGTYVNAKIQGVFLEKAAVVPEHLVRDGRIAIMSKSETLEYIPVEVVKRDGDRVVINGDLQNGDLMITTALSYPVEGMRLRLLEVGYDGSGTRAVGQNLQ